MLNLDMADFLLLLAKQPLVNPSPCLLKVMQLSPPDYQTNLVLQLKFLLIYLCLKVFNRYLPIVNLVY